ncbi:MAG: TonB-dependent receptor [Niastella sp.]|nr:TonB-dependent receptor [Niastella sp.]
MKCFILTGFLFMALPVMSQPGKTNISATVVDKISHQAIEFVTVVLLNQKDSTTVKAAITDKKGKFIITDILPGNYIMQYSYIGYSNSYAQHISVTGQQQNINLGMVDMSSDTKKLNEVVITSTKTTLNTAIDRKVYNVDQDIMSKSGAASDILKNIPSVEVDIDGQVSLRGSSNVMILINGKLSPLMGKTRAEVLQSLPANSIERIEVITNPSARYRPDGTSGIINIVLKKNTKLGWNGSVTANAGNNDRYSGNVSLNYNPGKINLFGSYSLRKDSRNRTNKIDRVYFDSTGKPASYYNEYNVSKLRPVSNVANLGMDYSLNDHNSFGISGNYYYRKLIKHDIVNKFTNSDQQILIENYDRLRYDPEYERQINGTVFFEHKFKKDDHEIRVEFNNSKSDELEDNHYWDVYKTPVRPTAYDNTRIKQADNENQLTIDYTLPINENSKLEAGYDGSFNKKNMDFYGEYYDTTQAKFIKDLTKSNQFLYKENIQAIYITYEKSYKKFGYAAGLRAEQVNINGNLVTLDSLIKNNYFKIYPTLHLSYKLSDAKELQLNYSRRINRPEADDLNPFPEYRDPRNLRAGNPGLKPEIINSVEFGYKWQNKNYSFVPSIYYRYKTNGFTQVIKPINDSTLLTTSENLANDQSAGLELIFSAKAGKFFSGNMSGNVFYSQIDASNLGYSQSKSIVSFSTNINTSFTVIKNSMIQLSGNYRSARLTPQGKDYPRFIANIGMRQDLMKKKLAITLTVSDLFASAKEKRDFNTLYLNQTSIGRRDARIFYLGVSYRFGQTKKAKKDDKLEFDNGG